MKENDKEMYFELTDKDKELIKNLIMKLVVRAYFANLRSRPRTVLDKLKRVFFKPKRTLAPAIDILDLLERSHKN